MVSNFATGQVVCEGRRKDNYIKNSTTLLFDWPRKGGQENQQNLNTEVKTRRNSAKGFYPAF